MTTMIPERYAADAPPPVKRRLNSVQRTDIFSLVGSMFAAAALAAGLCTFLPITGGLAPYLVGYVLFLGLYGLLVSFDESKETVRARLASAVIHTLAIILLSVLVLVVSYTVIRGFPAMVHWNFFTEDMLNAGPLDPLTVGGIKHALIGTLEQITIALIITVPLGVLCAVYLNEFPGGFARFVRTIVEAMTALPSIVAGLFIYAMWIIALGHDKSGYAAAFALSVMMLPIIIRASDVVLRLVPGHLKEASYALGTSHWRTVWHVVLPTTRSGLTTAVILGTARGIGETSPVLLTAGFNNALNANPAKGPQVSLPLQAFMAVKSPQPTMITRGFGAAAFLMILVLVLFIIARLIGGRGPGEVNNRQRRAIARRSARDVARFATRVAVLAAGLGLIGAAALHPVSGAYASGSYVPISGAGSTWSQNALDQWRRNVTQYGMQVNYQGTGSSDGRNQFRNGTVDFAVSEIPYGLKDAGVVDSPPARHYAYMPIVAGGTSFMYNLKIGGHRVTNLRLSGDTVAKIFTGKIATWNDPAIKRDNPLLALPAQRIVPVVRSDGSGTTAQLTTWLSKRYASYWDSYCHSAGRPQTPCGITSTYPVVSGSGFTAQSGSLGVAGYVAQDQNVGTITYVEYSYALNSGYPVVKLLNKGGYYVEPKAQNVAVALLKAKINTDTSSSNYLTQILDGVYDDTDPRAYPLSSYSYMVVPTQATGSFTTDKGRTLGAFAYYFLCEGQQQAPVLGYSPLPINLVQAGLAQVRKIPGVDQKAVDISKCNNPTFSANGTNTLAAKAPQPPACDKAGATQCTTGTGGTKATTPVSNGSSGSGTTNPTGTTGGSNVPAGSSAPPGSTTVDPNTGQVVTNNNGGSAAALGTAPGQSVLVAASSSSANATLLMILAGLCLLGVVILPPVLGRALETRRKP